MNNFPLISVIVPVYNAGESLLIHINTLLMQTQLGLEVIIVNDASEDNTKLIIDQLAAENDNIIPVHLKENVGVYEARLKGLEKAKAEWIGFMDADDFVKKNMYSLLLASALSNNVDIVICGYDRVTEDRKRINTVLKFKESVKVDENILHRLCMFEYGAGTLWNKLYNRRVVEPYLKMHFPWRQSINEDLLFNIGCFYQAESIYLIKNVLYEYSFNKVSVTSTINNAEAFVGTYCAFAIAIDTYSHLGADVLDSIINMYRTQLETNQHYLNDLDGVRHLELKIRAAVELIYKNNPEVLSLIAVRQIPSTSIRHAVKVILQKCLSLVGFKHAI